LYFCSIIILDIIVLFYIIIHKFSLIFKIIISLWLRFYYFCSFFEDLFHRNWTKVLRYTSSNPCCTHSWNQIYLLEHITNKEWVKVWVYHKTNLLIIWDKQFAQKNLHLSRSVVIRLLKRLSTPYIQKFLWSCWWACLKCQYFLVFPKIQK